jgi:glutathione-regulated potassium-efflux system ancillary protein KefC
MENHDVFFNAFLYLLAAVIAVPLSKRLGLGSVIGYLIAGVTIGPWGLGIIRDVEDILHFAEFGVVLLLFLIGLELNPGRLWAMRKPILGLGGAQVLASTLLITGVGTLAGLGWKNALITGMGLSLSSTALALQLLKEKNLLPTPAGNAGVSILLFQDLAVIPMLIIVPLLSDTATASGTTTDWLGFVKVIAVIAGIIIGGRYLLRPVFRVIAGTRLREIFTAFSLLLVIGIALLMQAVDMSMALGTFLAGVLLAESEYRHALESNIEPFKGLLLGLFFIAVGMSVDFGLLLERPGVILTLVAGLIVLKLAVLFALARMFKLPISQHTLFAVLLSQGGEFAFVLFGVATTAGVFKVEVSELLIVVVALSMMTTPLLMILNQTFFESRFEQTEARPMDVIEDRSNPVIIAGFGRFGQIVARLLHANGVGTTILDHDPEHIEMIRKFGFKVFYGDASRLDLLHAAGAEHASLLVLAINDREQTLEIVDIVRNHFPTLLILTRAWDVLHAFELLEKGVLDIERETFEGALRLGEQALKRVGFGAWQAKQATNTFRAHDQELLKELYKHFRDDLEVRVTISASARARLQEQMEADEAFFREHRDADWR